MYSGLLALIAQFVAKMKSILRQGVFRWSRVDWIWQEQEGLGLLYLPFLPLEALFLLFLLPILFAKKVKFGKEIPCSYVHKNLLKFVTDIRLYIVFSGYQRHFLPATYSLWIPTYSIDVITTLCLQYSKSVWCFYGRILAGSCKKANHLSPLCFFHMLFSPV